MAKIRARHLHAYMSIHVPGPCNCSCPPPCSASLPLVRSRTVASCFVPQVGVSRVSATCASTVQRIRMCPTAPAPVDQGVATSLLLAHSHTMILTSPPTMSHLRLCLTSDSRQGRVCECTFCLTPLNPGFASSAQVPESFPPVPKVG